MSDFVTEFSAYLAKRTDAPPDFHPYAALTSLSAALGNKVWVTAWGTRPIYPNIWTVLIAPSGYGKSTPLDMSETLLTKAQMGEKRLPTSFSQEALLNSIAQAKTGGVFYVQEFSAFLAMMGRDYNAGSMQWLTELYDVPESFERVLKLETMRLQRPFITILGASSPEWFADSFKANMLRGGFLARFLFCPSREAGPYIGLPPERDENIEVPLAYHLQQVGQLQGLVDLSKIRQRYNDWDRQARSQLRAGDSPPEFSGMRSRSGALVLKCAMLFHVSREPDNLVLTDRDLSLAIKFVEASQLRAERYLSEEVAHDKDDADRLRIIEIVRRAGGRVKWSKALKDSHMVSFKFKGAVETLVDSDRVRVETIDGGKVLIERVPLRSIGEVA